MENKDNPAENAQILCHGAGERGVANLDTIINKEGIAIVRDFEESNNYVASGVLSTNVLNNNKDDNSIDTSEMISYKYNYCNDQGEFFTIVTAFPLNIGDFTLGRVISSDKTNNCVLDDLNIRNIPKEFILGIIKSDVNNNFKFKLNKHFFALN